MRGGRDISALILLLVVGWSINKVEGQTFIQASDERIQYIGRYTSESNLTYSWPGFQISCVFTGKTVGIQVQNYYNLYSYHNVFVDGVQVGVINATDVIDVYSFGPFSSGQHTLLITQRGDASFGPTIFDGLYLDSNATLLTPPARPSRRIEIIGDSITVGGAILGPCNQTVPVHSDQDNYLTYGAITARNVSADYMVEARSGIGLVSSHGFSLGLPFYYNRLDFEYPTPSWDFSRWVPDAVLIHLGTNDQFQADNASSIFISTYVSFIETIQKNYAPAKPTFFLLCGSTIVPSIPWCPFAAKVAGMVGGNFIDLSHSVTSADIGCAGHPGPGGHQKMAAVVIPVVKQVMGW